MVINAMEHVKVVEQAYVLCWAGRRPCKGGWMSEKGSHISAGMKGNWRGWFERDI